MSGHNRWSKIKRKKEAQGSAKGKLVNPVTRKTELDLEGAQISIDVLSMLQEKTRGNLTRDEEKAMKAILQELQSIYVQMAM